VGPPNILYHVASPLSKLVAPAIVSNRVGKLEFKQMKNRLF